MTFIVGVFLLGAFSALGKQSAVSPALNEALNELRASASVWRDNDKEFRSMRQSANLPKDEVGEFAEFVAGLKRQVLENCQAVRALGGEKFLKDFDCQLPKEPPKSLATLPSRPEEYKTEAEEAESLDYQLRKIEIGIDVVVKNNTQKLARRSNSLFTGDGTPSANDYRSRTDPKEMDRKASGTSGAQKIGGDKPAEVGKNDIEKREGPIGAVSASGAQRNRDPGAGPGLERKGKRAVTPINRGGTGDDDDVLAAQLREAAEKETDPILREKLWSEYKKYKASTR